MARNYIQWVHPDGRIFRRLNTNDAGYAANKTAFLGLSLTQQVSASSSTIPANQAGLNWNQQLPAYPGSLPPSKNIVLVGDAFASDIAPTLSTLYIDQTVRHMGVAGDTSYQAAFRWGSVPVRLTPSGGSIPASGGIAVTVVGLSAYPAGILQVGQSVPGTLSGVPGTLSRNSGGYSFTRTNSGASVAVSGSAEFFVSTTTEREITVIITGRANYADTADLVRDLASMVDLCARTGRPYLILTIPNQAGGSEYFSATDPQPNYATLMATNETLRTIWRDTCLDWREALVHRYNPALAQDVTDIGRDELPASLRSGPLQLNSAGRLVAARLIKEKLTALYPAVAPADPSSNKQLGAMLHYDFSNPNCISQGVGQTGAGASITNLVTGASPASIVGEGIVRAGKGIKLPAIAGRYIDLGNQASSLTDSFVAIVWMRQDVDYASGVQGIFGRASSLAPGQAQFAFDTGESGLQPRAGVYSASTSAVSQFPAHATGDLVQLALCVAGGQLTTFKNGTLLESVAMSGPLSVPGSSLRIGGFLAPLSAIVYGVYMENLSVSGRAAQAVVTQDFTNHLTRFQ